MTDVDVTLSDDAKAMVGAWFGLGGSKTTVTLHMRESKPTMRCRAALDELVAAGVLSKEPINGFGGEKYKPLIDTMPYFKWMNRRVETNAESVRFQLMEPIQTAQPPHLEG